MLTIILSVMLNFIISAVLRDLVVNKFFMDLKDDSPDRHLSKILKRGVNFLRDWHYSGTFETVRNGVMLYEQVFKRCKYCRNIGSKIILLHIYDLYL